MSAVEIEVAGRTLRVSSPDKLYYPRCGVTKLDLVRYYEEVAPALLAASGDRPLVLKRYPDGVEGDHFYQKRAPKHRPPWLRTATYRFPSGRSADEVVLADAAHLLWTTNLGCLEVHAHPVRAADLDHPDELRADLDPGPGVPFEAVIRVAGVVREVLGEHRLVGWPKTSGSRGVHVYAPIAPRWGFSEVRRAGLALARAVEERVPELATSRWWKEERHGVFVDYNQNARDRTMAAAYAARATPDARVSTPLDWDELPGAAPDAYTTRTVPARLAERGDPWAEMRASEGGLESLLALADEQERAGASDAAWPPHHPKGDREPPRAPPSRRRRAPLVIVARAKRREDALAGLERWRERHPEAARHLREDDVLVDAMRGRHSTWTRVRVNLRRVPEGARPGPESPDPDERAS